jgi:small-conductance mechanosensitive channel
LRVFQFTLMEIGNWVHADQCTGRIVHIPNAKVFVEPQVNYTKGWFDYIWNEVAVLVPYESNWKRARDILREIAEAHAGHLTGPAERKMRDSAKNYMIFSANLAPTVFTSVEESGILLTVRYLCEPRRRRESTQEIWEAALERFSEHNDIDFAYPTIRYYNNTVEGKRGIGAMRPEKDGN